MPREDARARAIVTRLSEGNASSDEVFAAFEELDHLPPEVVRDAFVSWTGPAPDLERLDDSVRRAHRLPLRTPTLKTLASDRDADVLELGTLAEEQLRVAGKTWDGQDLEAFDRLDGEREDSFAGTLERRVLGEGTTPLYDVMLFGEGAGVFFRAGTTTVLGVLADHRVETTDRPARVALERALAASPQAPAPAAVPAPLPAPPRAVAKKKQLELPMDHVAEPEPAPEPQPEPEPAPKRAPAAPKKKKAAAAKKKTAATPAPAPAKKKAAAKKKTATAPTTAKKKTASKKKSSSS